MDIALRLGVCDGHLPPLHSIDGFEGHNITKITPIVVLWLYRLMTTNISINYVNDASPPIRWYLQTVQCVSE